MLVIAPSRRLDELAAEHQGSLPPVIRGLLRSVGVAGVGKGASGSALTSYLLFEPSFTTELINLGMSDTLARRADVQRFFGWPAQPPQVDPAALRRRHAGFAEMPAQGGGSSVDSSGGLSAGLVSVAGLTLPGSSTVGSP